jgi:carboxypeptidase PM20D1
MVKNRFTMAFLAISLILVAVVIIIIIKTYVYPFQKINLNPDKYVISDTSELPVKRFIGGLMIPTISSAKNEETDFGPFDRFKGYLENSYPGIYRTMETRTINDYGLVFRWKGKNQQLKPILFLSHYDVVPPGDYSENKDGWDHPPFSGALVDGKIYGRGAIDMKCMLFGIMESSDKGAAMRKMYFRPTLRLR